ncbi:hypothetical protein BDW68DRAFT_183492 [Aspergillus falconensis]
MDPAALSASQSGRTGNDLWKLVATSASKMERPAVASPIIEPREHKQASVDIEPTPNTATANSASQKSAPTLQTRSPPRTNSSESSSFATTTAPQSTQIQISSQASLPAQDSPGNGATSARPKRALLADEFRTDVNRYVIGFAEKVQALEIRLEQSLADNASQERRLHEVENALAGKTTRVAHLLRQVEELTEDKRKMEEELRQLEEFRDAIRRLENTRVLDVLRSWNSGSSSGQT